MEQFLLKEKYLSTRWNELLRREKIVQFLREIYREYESIRNIGKRKEEEKKGNFRRDNNKNKLFSWL